LHHSLDPVVNRLYAPFKTLANLDVHIHDLARSLENVLVLDFKEIFQCAYELLGFRNEIKDFHYRNEHCHWIRIPLLSWTKGVVPTWVRHFLVGWKKKLPQGGPVVDLGF
jgi:hypothetical protein